MTLSAPFYRRALGGAALLAAALLVNLFIFGLAPWLVSETVMGSLPAPLRMVALFKPVPPPQQPDEQAKPPEPPPAVRKLDPVKPQEVRSPEARPDLDLTPPDLDINSQLKSGPALAAPPPMPRPGPGELDQGPLVTSRVPPMYPYLARMRGVEGWVKVRFLVNSQGNVEQLSILASQPEGYFEEAVLRTVSRWRFKPALRQGRPQESWLETTIRFDLE